MHHSEWLHREHRAAHDFWELMKDLPLAGEKYIRAHGCSSGRKLRAAAQSSGGRSFLPALNGAGIAPADP